MGNITEYCCKSKSKLRVTIIGFDDIGKKEIYETVTSEKITSVNGAEHFGKKTKLDNVTAYVSYVPLGEELVNLWNSEVTHSDGVIFVVDFANEGILTQNIERIKDVYWNIIEQKENYLILFVRNASNRTIDELKEVFEINGQDINVIKMENNVQEEIIKGVTWLFKTISIKTQ